MTSKTKKSFQIARQAFFVLGLKPQKPLPAASRLSPVVNKKRYLENLNVHFVIFVYSVCRVVMGKLISSQNMKKKMPNLKLHWRTVGRKSLKKSKYEANIQAGLGLISPH